MPNHCETDLIIKGEADLIEKILAEHFNEAGELICDSLIPYPKEFKQLDEIAAAWAKLPYPKNCASRPIDGFNQGGCAWCVANWGTKWGAYDGRGIVRQKGKVKMSFVSAWTPPYKAIDELASRYPQASIDAKSYERGAGFKCDFAWRTGKSVKSNTADYSGERGG